MAGIKSQTRHGLKICIGMQAWDPWMIMAQIVTMQCIFYTSLIGIQLILVGKCPLSSMYLALRFIVTILMLFACLPLLSIVFLTILLYSFIVASIS